jgi:hypothetical protein
MTSAYWIVLLALFPIIGGLFAWIKFHTIVWWEWIASVTAAIVLGAITFSIAEAIITSDQEIWSGYVTGAEHTPYWVAEWEEEETYTDSDGKEHTRTVTRTQTHYPRWWVNTTIGEIDIQESRFENMGKKFGIDRSLGWRPNFDSGDRFDYHIEVENPDLANVHYPVHKKLSWRNPFLSSNTVRLGREISHEEARKENLFEHPDATDPFRSKRVIGTNAIDPLKWDRLCAELGATWKVNLILINFGDRPISTAALQRDYWKNGKKNDLVLCVGTDWAYVFGWAKSDLVKKELETILLENEINNEIIPKIRDAVKRDFVPYEWCKEEEVARPVPTGSVITAFIIMALSQIGLAYLFHHNEWTKTKVGWKHPSHSYVPSYRSNIRWR